MGPNCKDKAKEVANANAATDEVPWYGWPLFLLGFGEGWSAGGPHFPSSDWPGSLYWDEHDALDKCSLDLLGKATHEIQDKWAHAGISPRLHWITGATADVRASQDAAVVDGAMQETAALLNKFKSMCLRCICSSR